MSAVDLRFGDCLAVLRQLEDESVAAVVTDPPYELGFMGKGWDGTGIAYNVELWREALRVLKPGGHLAAFGGTRTYHRMTCAIEDAGFEIRDSLMWAYGSGFPKSLDVSKAIDKHGPASGAAAELKEAIGAAVRASGKTRAEIDTACGFTMRFDVSYERDPAGWGISLPTVEQFDVIVSVLGEVPDWPRGRVEGIWRGRAGAETSINAAMSGGNYVRTGKGDPATPEAATWSGWGTALKPAQEPIVLARKPLVGTVAANVLAHGTGGLNVDACRTGAGDDRTSGGRQGSMPQPMDWGTPTGRERPTGGRWPANVLLSHGEACADACVPGCPVAELDAQSGITTKPSKGVRGRGSDIYANGKGFANTVAEVGQEVGYGDTVAEVGQEVGYGDTGGASRFFPVFRYQAKAPARERPKIDGQGHPTVKPLALMRWLVKLITPPGGLVLDPFAGTGTTLQAARDEGFRSIGIESWDLAYRLACQRLGLPDVLPEPVPAAEPEPVALEVVPEPEPEPVDPILVAIGECADEPAALALWAQHKAAWTAEHTEAVRARLPELRRSA